MPTSIENIMPENFLLPGSAMKFDLTNAIRGLPGMPRAIMLCGFANIDSPRLPVGAAQQVRSEKEAIGIAGLNSVLHQMYKALPSIVQLSMPVYFYRLDETIGTAAQTTATITFTGTLGIDVPCNILANGINIPITLTAGSDKNAVSAAIAAAITANSTQAAMSVTVADNVVTATNLFGGTESNNMLLCIQGLDKADVAITGGIVISTPGTGNQDVSSLLAYLATTRITEIAWPGSMNDTVYGVVSAALEELWGPAEQRDTQILEVISAADVGTASSILSTRNSHQVHSLCIGVYLNSPVWSVSACAGANIEYSAAIDPAVPLKDIQLVGLAAPSDNFEDSERNSLLVDGGSTVYITDGNIYIERMVTNYTHNSINVDDASYRNLEWIKTMSWWRWYCTIEFALSYTNFKLAEVYEPEFDGQKIMTLELAEEVMLGLYNNAITAGLMQDRDGYKQDLQMGIAGASGRLKYIEKPRLITQLFQIEVTSEPILGSLS